MEMFNFTEKQRAWAYRVLLAVAGLAVIYGVADEIEVAGWVALGAAILGNGLAAANTSTKTDG